MYIIAGPNGAGKTTFARKFLPKYADCRNFVNADLIAQGLSPLAPEQAAIRAGRIVLHETHSFLQKRVDFGFETTLSGRGYLNLFRRFNGHGYRITIFFLLVPSAEASLARIRARVARGGHDVPECDVRRRFDRSIGNFLSDYRQLADSWFLFDNEGATPELIATWDEKQLHIIDIDMYRALEDRYVRQI